MRNLPASDKSSQLAFAVIWLLYADVDTFFQELFRAGATLLLLMAAVHIGEEKSFTPWVKYYLGGLFFQVWAGIFPAFTRTFLSALRSRWSPPSPLQSFF